MYCIHRYWLVLTHIPKKLEYSTVLDRTSGPSPALNWYPRNIWMSLTPKMDGGGGGFKFHIWMFPKIGGSFTPPKWMVYFMVPNPIKMDDLGVVSYFWKHPYKLPVSNTQDYKDSTQVVKPSCGYNTLITWCPGYGRKFLPNSHRLNKFRP